MTTFKPRFPKLYTFTNSPKFQTFIMTAIVFNAALMGLETSHQLMESYGSFFKSLNLLLQLIFVSEIALKIVASAPRFVIFFKNGWNLFDFTVVALSFLPTAGAFATVARLARVLRVLRLVSVSKELRLIIETMLKSIPSMGHVAALLGLLFYIFGIFGFYKFSTVDPENWGSLGRAFQTLFQIITLEGWVDFQTAVLATHSWAWVYFLLFIVLGVFVVINLFIAVVLNNLEIAREELLRETQLASVPSLKKREQLIQEIKERLSQLENMT